MGKRRGGNFPLHAEKRTLHPDLRGKKRTIEARKATFLHLRTRYRSSSIHTREDASTSAGKLQYFHGKTPVPPRENSSTTTGKLQYHHGSTGIATGLVHQRKAMAPSTFRSEQRERRRVGGADAPGFGIKVVDAATDALARPKLQPPIAKRDRPSGSLHAKCLAPQILQRLVVRQVDAGSITGSGK